MKPIRTLRVSISGVRGVVGDTLKPALVLKFARAFATYLGRGTILVGRDTRRSGEMVEHAVNAGLLASGMSVVSLGVCPVPSLQLAVRNHRCRGGIAITASHNPAQWNALKFVKSNGHFLNRYESEELLALYHQDEFSQVDADRIRPLIRQEGAVEEHIRAILETIKPKLQPSLRIVADCCNGAGAVMTPQLLRAMGCHVIELNCIPDGNFPRPPEPIPENLHQLRQAVLEHRADLGFAQDADADRLAVVSEQGEAIGEEYSLALCAYHVLSREPGPMVCNLSSSRMNDDIAAQFGVPLTRTRIGEVNVTETMVEVGAVIGGEGNGGVIYPKVNMARDSFVGMALIVDLIRSSGLSVAGLQQRIPAYRGRKLALEMHPHRISSLLDHLSRIYSGEQQNHLDGLKVDWPDGWFHVRPSNTEPIVRVVIEARTGARLEEIRRQLLSHMG